MRKNYNKTIFQIQKRIDQGEVVILTAQEICDRVRSKDIPELKDVDVVTTATTALMSGTYAVLSFKVAEPDTFVKAQKVWINTIPAHVGPCPNERIGILDLIVLGTASGEGNPEYGAGHLFKDLVSGKQVQVVIETDDGKTLTTSTTLSQIPHAMLHATRNAFKNYLAFVNPGKDFVSTIFHSDMMKGDYGEMTFCGCGELNPLENDPELKTIGIGTRVLINGAPGFVTGPGTRSSGEKPNLAGVADMHHMDPELMGGFSTGHGPDIICTWAIAIPVLDQEILTHVLKTDEQIPLTVVDVRNRKPIASITYGDVWDKTGGLVAVNPESCLHCSDFCVERTCPVKAISRDIDRVIHHDRSACFHCGLCIARCRGKVFTGQMAHIKLEGVDKEIPVTLRQSDRLTAVTAALDLKERICKGRFRLTEPVGKIRFPDKGAP